MDEQSGPSRPTLVTRRGVLALGGAAVVGGAGLAWSTRGPGFPVTMTPEVRAWPVPVERAALPGATRVGAATYRYEVTGAPATYWAEPAFAARLGAWLADFSTLTGLRPDTIRGYGAWAPGEGKAWHGAGQAFDLARLQRGGKDVVSARYDLWRGQREPRLTAQRAAYWRLVATLHLHFADVLTYRYDAAHATHLHVDSGRFGAGAPRLIERSRVQVTSVQAICQYVWRDSSVQISGQFDEPTAVATRRVLAGAGFPGEIWHGVEGWSAFMRASARHVPGG